MGVFDKIMFWKKDDDLDFDKLAQDAMKREEQGGSSPNGDWGMEHAPLGSPDRPLFPQDQSNQSPAQDEFKVPPMREQPNQFQNQTSQNQSNSLNQTNPQGGREIELINSKLDTIKAMLNSIDQRLNSIESEKKETKKLW